MHKTRHHSAFTIVELISGVLILTIMGLSGWFVGSVLFRESQMTRNREIAVNLLQKSQEELRRAAQVHFDNLESCNFTQSNPCGFEPLSAEFQGFQRNLNVTTENSPELKRALMSVQWQELGSAKTISSVMILSRPPDPLPGNIIGLVFDAQDKGQIAGARVTLTRQGSGESRSTISRALTSVKNGFTINYDFSETGTNRFLLTPGSWALTAAHPNYHDYSHPDIITVDSNEERAVDFFMQSLPEDGRLTARLINFADKSPVSFNSQSFIELYEDASRLARRNNSGSLSFDVEFSDENKRCFTVRTNNAYISAFAGNFSCSGLTYHPEGWSSAVVQEDGSLACSNPFNGNASVDRICVSPADDKVADVPVVPVPTASANGLVVDQNGSPIAGAEIYVSWHDNNAWQPRPAGITDANGFYRVVIPAEQAMFANTASNYPRIEARARATVTRCCEAPATETRTATARVNGPVFPGNDRPVNNLVINLSPSVTSCGNKQGNVKDDKIGSSINGAQINVAGLSQTTTSGAYLYSCPADGFRLPAGNHNFAVTQNNYYPFRNTANAWYNSTPQINVVANILTAHNDVLMWPVGRGTIRVVVKDAATLQVLSGVTVKLLTHNTNGNAVTTTQNTNQSGVANFSNVLESWPIQNLTLGNPKYNQTSRTHGLEVSYTDFYETYQQSNILLNNGDTKQIEVLLIPKGQM